MSAVEAFRLTAFHLPPRLSLANNGEEQGGSHLRRRRGVTAVSPPGRGGCEPAAGMQEPGLERLWRILSCVDGVALYRSESSKCLAHYCSFKKIIMNY